MDNVITMSQVRAQEALVKKMEELALRYKAARGELPDVEDIDYYVDNVERAERFAKRFEKISQSLPTADIVDIHEEMVERVEQLAARYEAAENGMLRSNDK